MVTAGALFALPMGRPRDLNIKDVPARRLHPYDPGPACDGQTDAKSRSLLRVAGLVAGITLMVGTRPAMVGAVLVERRVARMGAPWPRQRSGGRRGRRRGVTGRPWPAFLVAVYPNVFAHPAARASAAVIELPDSDGCGHLYIPFYLVAQFPLLLQGLAVVGLLFALRVVRSGGASNRAGGPPGPRRGAAAALPLVAFAKNSDLYNGLRQLLFASPAWAVLVTVGLAHALTWARSAAGSGWSAESRGGARAPWSTRPRSSRTSTPTTTWPSTRPGRTSHSDYWRTSVPELLPDIPRTGSRVRPDPL